MEALSLFSTEDVKTNYKFVYTASSNCNRLFNYGCDAIQLRFEKDFEKAFES